MVEKILNILEVRCNRKYWIPTDLNNNENRFSRIKSNKKRNKQAPKVKGFDFDSRKKRLILLKL